MAELSTFIKLDRNITQWRWYQNANTFRVFIHCLISANVKDHPFEKIIIKRGEFATSYEKIALALDLSVQQVRTAIEHLRSTGELTGKKYSKYQVISIVNYELYQSNQQANNRQITGYQQSINSQLTVNQQQSKNDKKEKNDKNISSNEDIGQSRKRFVPPTLEEVKNYCDERQNCVDASSFIDYYSARGWELTKGRKVKDWKACVRTWERNSYSNIHQQDMAYSFKSGNEFEIDREQAEINQIQNPFLRRKMQRELNEKRGIITDDTQ